MTDLPRDEAATARSDVSTAGISVGSQIRGAVTSIKTSGAMHYVVALFAVQGLSYLTQFTIARVTGPVDFAIVRTVESVLNVLLVAASLGMPMLAVTTIAGLADTAAQGRMIGALLTISACGGLVVAFGAMFGAGLLAPPAPHFLRAMAWIMAITAASRTSLNYFQGRQQVQRVAGFSVLLSCVSLAMVVVAVLFGGLRGWILGRYVSELLFLAMMVRAIGPTLRFSGPLPAARTTVSLLGAGAGIAVSLLVRTAGDNAGIFILNAAKVGRAEIGYFGLSSLALVAILIIPGSVPSVALPRLVARLNDRAAVMSLVRRVGFGSLGASVAFAGVAGLLAGPAIRLFLPSYAPAIQLLYILLLAVPFRLLSSMSGMVLVACGAVRHTVWINLLALIVTAGVGWLLTQRAGAIGVAQAVVTGELVSALAYAFAARHVLTGRLAQSPSLSGSLQT